MGIADPYPGPDVGVALTVVVYIMRFTRRASFGSVVLSSRGF